jgi:hypothetical protein
VGLTREVCSCDKCEKRRERDRQWSRSTTLLALPGDRDDILAVELRRAIARDNRFNPEERRTLSNVWWCNELRNKYGRRRCSYWSPCCYCEEIYS